MAIGSTVTGLVPVRDMSNRIKNYLQLLTLKYRYSNYMMKYRAFSRTSLHFYLRLDRVDRQSGQRA